MASVDGTPVPPAVQAKVNGIVEQDAAKGRVPVHTFDPDASPEDKAAAAGKTSAKLGLEDESLKSAAKGECVCAVYPPPPLLGSSPTAVRPALTAAAR